MLDKTKLEARNKELADYLAALLGNDVNDFLAAIPEDKAIRVNTLKTSHSTLLKSLKLNATLKRISFSPDGYKVESEKNPLSQSLEFFKGHFAFQGASSQIPPVVLNPGAGEKVLDMAASPGSKTTQMGVMMQNAGELVINDSNLSRMQALNTNTQKTGLINQSVYYLAGERLGRLFPEYFDKVLLDAPCTGLGTLASNPEVLSWWSYKKLDKLVKIQKQLIVSAIKATKVGGEIVYSTCSVAPEENELLIQDILQHYPVKVLPVENQPMDKLDSGLQKYNNIEIDSSLSKAIRVWPHKHKMEGFFIARLHKTAEYYNKNNPRQITFIDTLSYDDAGAVNELQSISQSWGISEHVWKNFRFIKTRERIWLLNKGMLKIVAEGFNNAGMLLAEKRLNIWKLTHQAVQFLSAEISKRKIMLPPAEVKQLFSKGCCDSPVEERGYFALVIKDQPSAIVYIDNKEIRIKLNHPYNFVSFS